MSLMVLQCVVHISAFLTLVGCAPETCVGGSGEA